MLRGVSQQACFCKVRSISNVSGIAAPTLARLDLRRGGLGDIQLRVRLDLQLPCPASRAGQAVSRKETSAQQLQFVSVVAFTPSRRAKSSSLLAFIGFASALEMRA
jgi:hypothetical protein